MRTLNSVFCSMIISACLLPTPDTVTPAPVTQAQEGVFIPSGAAQQRREPTTSTTQTTGELVFIERWNKAAIAGRLVSYTSDGIVAIVGGVETRFPRSGLRRVSRWRPRTPKGALIGGSFGVLAGVLVPCDICSPAEAIVGQATLWGGVGALVGRIHGERQTLYP